MARLQDFQTVTPTSSDNLLIVQSQGQGLASVGSTLGAKMDKANPTGTGALSINRKSGTTTGNYSATLGRNCTASGTQAIAEGGGTTASGTSSHSEGNNTIASGNFSHTEGDSTTASGNYSHAEGLSCTASGARSHAEGDFAQATGDTAHAEGTATIANHRAQHVFGQYNLADASTAEATSRGNYVEIVGNGANSANRSNARTLDWQGNEVLAGGLKINGNQDVGIAPIGYNANTDRNTESVRQTAMRYLRTNYFSKGGSSSSVRYSGGYYFTYLFGGITSYGYDTFVEFAQSLTSGEKIIYWGYNVTADSFTKLFSIS